MVVNATTVDLHACVQSLNAHQAFCMPGGAGSNLAHGRGLPCRVAGLRGTGALLLAYWLHLDAFGGLHWDGGDLALGLALGAPMVCLGALVGRVRVVCSSLD